MKYEEMNAKHLTRWYFIISVAISHASLKHLPLFLKVLFTKDLLHIGHGVKFLSKFYVRIKESINKMGPFIQPLT